MAGRNGNNHRHRAYLQHIANRAMLERGLLPEFSFEALAELERILGRALEPGLGTRDLRHLPWCSIDNDDSRDLDQLTAAEALAGEAVRVFVAIADVDGFVKKGSAIDSHARRNTTSVYTDVVFRRAWLSMAESFLTNPSTSAIATNTRTASPARASAAVSWSRSRESSLSMEHQGRWRKSRVPSPGSGANPKMRSSSASASGENSGSRPRSSMARLAICCR